MVTKAENERLTRVEGDAPMGRMIREDYWVPFALSSHLVAGEAPISQCASWVRITSPFAARTARSGSSTSTAPAGGPP